MRATPNKFIELAKDFLNTDDSNDPDGEADSVAYMPKDGYVLMVDNAIVDQIDVTTFEGSRAKAYTAFDQNGNDWELPSNQKSEFRIFKEVDL